MPLSTETPVLTVDPATIANIDPQVPENLFGMWSAFSRCSGIMENGKRFENLYWRVWNHKSLSNRHTKNPRLSHASKLTARQLPKQKAMPLPELSSSVESLCSSSSENAMESTPESSRSSLDKVKTTFDPYLHGEKEKHLSPIDLKELVVSIKEKQDLTEPIPSLHTAQSPDSTESPPASRERSVTQDSTPRPSSPRPVHTESSPLSVRHESSNTVPGTDDSRSPTETSSTSYTSNLSPHNVVRGFLPGRESSYRSQTQLAPSSSSPAPIGILKPSGGPRGELPKKKPLFMLGGGSSGEDEGSVDKYMARPLRSSLSECVRRSVDSGSRKQTSFDENVTEIKVPSIRPEDNEAVFEDTDEEEDDDSESGIDEDDDEDAWENASDEGESAPPSEPTESIFRRVDSSTNLPSHRSLLTVGLHEGDRRSALQNEASRSTPAIRRSRTSTPNGPSIAASPDEDSALELRGTPILQPKPAPAPTSSAAMSPRTTRRNMLMTEIPEDLRKDLLHERKQRLLKPLNGMIPRRHTSQDVTNLKSYPTSGEANGVGEIPENYYFNNGVGEYHASGW